jgi:hypothetical protein
MGKLIREGWQTSVQDAQIPSQEISPSPMPSSLELEAAAMRLKLEQNRRALQEQGIQSASEKIKQFSEQ